MNRFLRGLRSLRRLPEVAHCFRNVAMPLGVTGAFLGINHYNYPIDIKDRAGRSLRLYDFEDLTTLWAVWCADEYRVPANAHTVLDLGANIGAFSLFTLANAPQARVIALEPFPSTFAKLQAVIAKNGIGSQVFCEQAAISAFSGVLHMQSDETIKSHSRKTMDGVSVPEQTIAVPSLGLADLLEKYDADEVDYIKVDIEGGEVPLFRDVNPGTLLRAKRIGVECHSNEGQQLVWERLKAAGFRLERVSRGSFAGSASTAEFQRI